jgi:hypothetical protein
VLVSAWFAICPLQHAAAREIDQASVEFRIQIDVSLESIVAHLVDGNGGFKVSTFNYVKLTTLKTMPFH